MYRLLNSVVKSKTKRTIRIICVCLQSAVIVVCCLPDLQRFLLVFKASKRGNKNKKIGTQRDAIRNGVSGIKRGNKNGKWKIQLQAERWLSEEMQSKICRRHWSEMMNAKEKTTREWSEWEEEWKEEKLKSVHSRRSWWCWCTTLYVSSSLDPTLLAVIHYACTRFW